MLASTCWEEQVCFGVSLAGPKVGFGLSSIPRNSDLDVKNILVESSCQLQLCPNVFILGKIQNMWTGNFQLFQTIRRRRGCERTSTTICHHQGVDRNKPDPSWRYRRTIFLSFVLLTLVSQDVLNKYETFAVFQKNCSLRQNKSGKSKTFNFAKILCEHSESRLLFSKITNNYTCLAHCCALVKFLRHNTSEVRQAD